MNFKI